MRKLTGKQQALVRHYCGDAKYNGSEAYRRAGYSLCKGWEHNAIKVLHKDYVKAAIQAKIAENSKKIEVTVEFIVQKLLTGLALAEKKQDLVAIARFSELLGKYKAMFTDNVKQSGEGLRINITEAKPPLRLVKGV